MRRFKEKRRVLGYMKFVGQLYRHLLLVEKVKTQFTIFL